MTLADRVTQQSPAVRRALAVLVLFATVALACQAVIPPIGGLLTSQHRWRVHVRPALAIARGRAAEAPGLHSLIKTLPDAPIWQRFYPDGDPANEAAAIRGDVTLYAAVAGVTFRSIAPSPPSEQFGLRRIGLKLSATMTIAQLKTLLTQLRDSPRYLRVDALTVTAPQIQTQNANDSLLVQLQIFGYARPKIGRTQ